MIEQALRPRCMRDHFAIFVRAVLHPLGARADVRWIAQPG
jgi:hypothetical protein